MRDCNNVEDVSSRELTDEELSTVSGGKPSMNSVDIKGDVTSPGHEKWIELDS